tara:strand:- start:215 stop:739 length:525 start_codon:yes stop_codon:yes gene_type:complete
VTAVSNINLLPDREDRVKKEKKKTQTTSLMKKFSVVTGIGLAATVAIYGFMMLSLPSSGDILAIQQDASKISSALNKRTKEYKDLSKWTYESGTLNNMLLDITYTASFPRGSFITKVMHNRKGSSLMEIKINDPELSSKIMTAMSKKFKNVQLLNIKEPTSGKMSTLEISFEIK